MRNESTYIADFETTVYDGQTRTDVWAAAIVKMYTEDVILFNNIDNFCRYLESLEKNVTVYFHNLRFDGTFLLHYYLRERKFTQAFNINKDDARECERISRNNMKSKQIRYLISSDGQWYSMTVKVGPHYIEFRDSLKLLPFSVKKIGNDFKTPHRKLEMEYKGYRQPGGVITDEEAKYIKNDVLVVKEALEVLFAQGHRKMTIGSCCIEEYKKSVYLDDNDRIFRKVFPDLTEFELKENEYGSKNAEEYVRNSYKGGWCYLVPSKANYIHEDGITLDVNSLYPSMMSSQSGNYFPVGLPTFWRGNFIPDEAKGIGRYFFVRLKTRFHIRPGKLPTIQIKHMPHFYSSTKWLETSDIEVRDKHGNLTGQYSSVYRDTNGEVKLMILEMTMTQTDFQLMLDHYYLEDFEILDGCWFEAKKGIFDAYIEKYKKIKMVSKGAIREIAKLFLNNLYGKLASSEDSSYKVADFDENGCLTFATIKEANKDVVYIPCGSAITSYARNFTIRAAQKNYYGKHSRGFIYADTDSIHCSGLTVDELIGVPIDNTDFCHWKVESKWSEGIFIRQKTYAEMIDNEWDLKCAGMPQNCKDYFLMSLNPLTAKILKDFDVRAMALDSYGEAVVSFLDTTRTIKDFKTGLEVPGKLIPKQIPGGTLLCETTYKIQESFASMRGFG